MTKADLIPLLPYLALAAASIAVMLASAFFRRHGLAAAIALAGLGLSFAAACALFLTPGHLRLVTPLLFVDRYALFYTALIALAAFVIASFSHAYLGRLNVIREEFYVLLLSATLGAAVLAASVHFASFFLGIETLTISLYGLIAYTRSRAASIEAGVKYLILAAVSSAFVLFGIALLYAAAGGLSFSAVAALAAGGTSGPLLAAGLLLVLAGAGFKLAVVPFHLWTPDVYEGAPAPVAAFVATVSKGAVFAAVFRFALAAGIHGRPAFLLMLTGIAVASMLVGNLLALFQDNVKRMLAYSSIAHLGYLLIALVAGSKDAVTASALYLLAYFVTMLGAFGVVIVLSGPGRDAGDRDDYRGLARRRPWLAAIFTLMLLSLAGMPLTAGFFGKFVLAAAGASASLWTALSALVLGSVIGLFYYLRLISTLYEPPGVTVPAPPMLPLLGGCALAFLFGALFWIGVAPGPVVEIIRKAVLF